MNTAYGIRIHESNKYYICWKQKLMNQYRIFTIDGSIISYNKVTNTNYTDQITLTGDLNLHIQTESSMRYLPSERTQVTIEGRLSK